VISYRKVRRLNHPRVEEFIEHLPRTSVGKVNKKELREKYGGT